MITLRDETFDGTFPFAPHYLDLGHFALHAPLPTPVSRLALLCWSRDIPVNEEDTSYAEMKRIEQGLSQFIAAAA